MNLKISYQILFTDVIINSFSKKSNNYYIFVVVIGPVYCVENGFYDFLTQFSTFFSQISGVFLHRC